MHRLDRHSVPQAFTHSVALAISSLITFSLITNILVHLHSVSRDDDLLGGMWAVIATVFVYRYSYEQSTSAALSRVAATLVSFALCLAYLLFLPFSSWGMAILIGLGALVTPLIGRPNDTITTAITTAVVMVVAGISPANAWEQPILRLADTVVGVAVGFGFAWTAARISRWDTALLRPVEDRCIERS
jgi:uncharacterized membrane protein YccC